MGDIGEIIKILIILVVSVSLHEYAHAFVSYKLGDPTPKLQNRLTPNPINHMDPMGTVMMVIMVTSGRGIGRGKPVQINPSYYKNPLKGELMVALAGPATNILLAILGIFVLLVYARLSGLTQIQVAHMLSGIGGYNLVLNFWINFSVVNIMLALFNLLPIPPLDGFTVIKTFLPRLARKVLQYKMYFMIGFLIFVLGPGRDLLGYYFSHVGISFLELMLSFLSAIVY